MEFAKHEFSLMRSQPDGTNERDHQESAAEQFRKFGLKPKDPLAVEGGPTLPSEIKYLWDWFTEHVMGLPANGMCIPTVSWESLRAWCEFVQVSLAPWEAVALIRLGNLRLQILSEKK